MAIKRKNQDKRRHSSVGQSARFTSVRSRVRAPLSPPCRSKVRFAPFFLQEKHPPASLHFLFHKKLRSARLFGCKRPYDGSLSLPAFACYEGLTPTAEMPKKIFSCDSHKNPRTSVPGFFLFRFAPFFSINTRIFGRE